MSGLTDRLRDDLTLGELRELERQQTIDDYYASLEPSIRLLAILGVAA